MAKLKGLKDLSYFASYAYNNCRNGNNIRDAVLEGRVSDRAIRQAESELAQVVMRAKKNHIGFQAGAALESIKSAVRDKQAIRNDPGLTGEDVAKLEGRKLGKTIFEMEPMVSRAEENGRKSTGGPRWTSAAAHVKPKSPARDSQPEAETKRSHSPRFG